MKKCNQIVVYSDADWNTFDQISDFLISDYKAKIVKKIDGLDQRYYDYKINGKTLTLHLAHYLGIYLLSVENVPSFEYYELIEIRNKYLSKYEKKFAFTIVHNKLDVILVNNLFGFVKDNLFYSFADESDCLYGAPILEDNYKTLLTFLENNFGENCANAFPLHNIIAKSLLESEYYFKLALNYLNDGFPINPRILEIIKARNNDKTLTQDIRNMALKIVRKIR